MHLYVFSILGFIVPAMAFSQADSIDCALNYKKGAELYNAGIKLLNDSIASGDRAGSRLNPLRQALPYLQKADSMCPGDLNVVKALMSIYYATNNRRAYDRYRARLDSLRKK